MRRSVLRRRLMGQLGTADQADAREHRKCRLPRIRQAPQHAGAPGRELPGCPGPRPGIPLRPRARRRLGGLGAARRARRELGAVAPGANDGAPSRVGPPGQEEPVVEAGGAARRAPRDTAGRAPHAAFLAGRLVERLERVHGLHASGASVFPGPRRGPRGAGLRGVPDCGGAELAGEVLPRGQGPGMRRPHRRARKELACRGPPRVQVAPRGVVPGHETRPVELPRLSGREGGGASTRGPRLRWACPPGAVV
mmetsp:Transcript_69936/g.197305  ORF Transcript_69936/g.197305 Transcript_69936/m.197305 type:complete len:252 (-) Transcript_69936:37-792(-)